MTSNTRFCVLIAAPLLLGTVIFVRAQPYGAAADSIEIYQLGNQAFSLSASRPDSALLLANTALQLAEQVRDTQAQVSLWRIKGVVHYGQNRLPEAYENFERSYALAKTIHFREGRLLINLGNVFYKQKQYEKALEKFQGALSLGERKDTVLWMDALNNIGSVYVYSGKFRESIPYFERALVLQQAVGNREVQLPTIYNIASAQGKTNDLEASIQAFQRGIDLATTLNQAEWIAKFHSRMGITYAAMAYYIQGIQAHQHAMAIWDTLGNQVRVGNSLFNIGTIHQDNEDYDLALEYFQRALKVFQKVNHSSFQASTLNSIGNNFKLRGKYEQALKYFHKAKTLYEREGNNQSSLSFPLYNLGDSYERLNQLDSAVIYLNGALESTSEVDRNYKQALVFTSLGKVAQKQGLEEKAIAYYEKAVAAAQEENLRKEELDASWLLYQALKRQNRPAEALNYLERHRALQDSLFNEKSTREIAQLEAQYAFEQEKKELARQNEVEKRKLDEEIRRQRTWQLFLGCALLLSLPALFLFTRFQRFRRATALQQERLNNQINLQKLAFEQKERERLQEIDAFKSRFFANISHELRTPLTLILSPIHQLLKKENWERKDRTQLLLIRDNANNLLSRVNEILDLTKFDARQMQLQEKPTAFYDYTKRLAANFESFAQQKKQDLVFNYHLDKELNILLDREKFAHVFNNYLSNAIKYTPEWGCINVLFFEKAEAPQTLALEVRDTGIGIRQEDLPRIFERFYQADQSENKAGGSGIGLALSREVALAMRGRVWVKSEWGKGSSFFFEFPYKEIMGVVPPGSGEKETVPAQKAAVKDFLPARGQLEDRPEILVVEDNKQLRDYLQLLLSDHYLVHTAKNGVDALQKLPQLNCQLLVSDVMMPIMNGFELLTRLKESEQYHDMPIIMLTARSELQDKLKALRIGVDDYLLKPFVEDELLARVRNLLKNYRARQKTKALPAPVDPLSLDTTVSKADLQWLEQLESILKKEVGNTSFTLDQVQKELFISRRQMHRRVKKITGLTPNNYFREIRLQVARELLESGKVRTVSEAAAAVGFDTAKYFSTIYAQRFGKRPIEYF